MNIDVSRTSAQKWSLADYAALAVLIAAAAILLCSGLSVRSLWGSEGRWAVIAREMMHSGNYFLPTINGAVYFDKPLLSYWAIIPFSFLGGVTETSARIPAVLAGIGTVALVFAIGRTLFGYASGFIAGLVLLTTFMFGFWARTASAEVLNVIAIWSMLWVVLPARGGKRSFTRYLFFYLIAAVSSFLKGPLAPAVALTAVFALSCVDILFDIRKDGLKEAQKRIAGHFNWILSYAGFLAALCGLVLFALLLFLPVIVTGSWDAVNLMWRENVVRFLQPFDHVEPFYIYFKHVPVFLLPWTFAAAGSLAAMRNWEDDRRRRWLATVTVAIFLFFTISGSRRSYYILPLVPAFALIMGRSIQGFLFRDEERDCPVMKTCLVITAFLPLIAGLAMIVGYLAFGEYRHASQIIVGPPVIIASVAALMFVFKGRIAQGTVLVSLAFFCLLLWSLTAGAAIGERNRTLKPFARQLAGYINGVGDDKLAMYGVGNSSLIFYLDRATPIRALRDVREVCSFGERNRGGYLLTEETLTDRIEKECGQGKLTRILTQSPEGKKDGREGLVLFRAGEGP